jgi:hypothetical protein
MNEDNALDHRSTEERVREELQRQPHLMMELANALEV